MRLVHFDAGKSDWENHFNTISIRFHHYLFIFKEPLNSVGLKDVEIDGSFFFILHSVFSRINFQCQLINQYGQEVLQVLKLSLLRLCDMIESSKAATSALCGDISPNKKVKYTDLYHSQEKLCLYMRHLLWDQHLFRVGQSEIEKN